MKIIIKSAAIQDEECNRLVFDHNLNDKTDGIALAADFMRNELSSLFRNRNADIVIVDVQASCDDREESNV